VMRTLLDPPLSHMTTFGGHPVSCAAGLASLEILLGEGLVERAERTGEAIRAYFKELAAGWDSIVDVRGKGLLIGIEFQTAELARAFVGRCQDLGVIVSWTVYSGTTVRLAPPLNISEADLQQGLEIFKQALP